MQNMPEIKEKEQKTTTNVFGLDVEEMAKAGLHFGHRVSRINPKMKPYIYGTRSTVHIIDLEKTVTKFAEALTVVQKLIQEGKTLLLVGTKIQAKNLVKETAQECGLPYINERWLGGTLTNFETIRKRIAYFQDLEQQKESGEFEKYTKKEQAKKNQELEDLEIKFGGIKTLEKLPDAIFVLDMIKDTLAIKEARMKGVLIIGIADTNADPTLVDYAIPANDDAMSSVRYILEKVKDAILKVKAK